jgi:hypothetical protein
MLMSRCDLQPEKAGGWWYPQKFLRLSGAAGIVLEEAGKLKLDDLEPLSELHQIARC